MDGADRVRREARHEIINMGKYIIKQKMVGIK